MSVLRIKHQKDYVVIHKSALEDPNLSFKAKGLWAYCMSRPDDWEFHVSHLKTVSQDGKAAIYSAINELISCGYCRRIQTRNGGKFDSYDYEVHEIKIISPLTDFPRTENPRTENRTLLSKEGNQVSKKNPPPSSSKREPTAPPQKDDWRMRISSSWTKEEFEYAWKKLEENKGKVGQIQAYLEACMQNYRDANGFASDQKNRVERHRAQVKPLDGTRINGDLVTAREDRVEFTCGSSYYAVYYDAPDPQWNEKIKRWINNANT